MKKIILIFGIISSFSFQSPSKVKATVCQNASGEITKDEIKTCAVLLSDTTNFSIATFSIKWFNGIDTTEMPIHGQIPDYYYDLIDEIKVGTTFIYNAIAIRQNNQNYVTIIPNLKFVIRE
jgi:hypothetical protein